MPENRSTEEAIIKTAQKLFAKNGYCSTSMDDIARDVGITKPSIYYYFESKEHIYARIVNKMLKRIIVDLKRFLEESRLKKIRLHEIINAVIHDRMRDGTVIRLVDVKIIGMESKPLKEIRGTLEEMRSLVCSILKCNKVRNEKLAAEVLINSIHCYVLHANHNLAIAPAKEYGDYLTSLFEPDCRDLTAKNTEKKFNSFNHV
jgi:AcrR family transcriptional regulator